MTEGLDVVVFIGLGEHDRYEVVGLLGAAQGDEDGGRHF
jgi:hypothetical protein